jgi:hypothetical protein
MKALLKLNKSILAILLFTSLCFVSNYSHAQGLLGKIKKGLEDVKKTTDDAKKIKDDAKKQVQDVKNVTGAGGNGSGGSTGNSGSGDGSNSNSGASGGAATTGPILSNEKYYRITNVATGKVLTVVYSLDKALHTAMYESTIELKPLDNNSDAQQWHLYHSDRSRTDDQEQIFTKVGHNSENGGGYTMRLERSDSSNNPDDRINFLQMGTNVGDIYYHWNFQKLSNGYYRILSKIAMPEYINKRFEESRERWNEARSFQAVTVGGKTTIKQMKNADIDAQYWKLEELDYLPVSGR